MGYGNDLSDCVCNAVDHGVGKTPEKKFSRALQMPRPTFRPAANLSDGVVKFGDESVCGGRIALEVPEKGSSNFCGGVGVEFNVWTSHGIV